MNVRRHLAGREACCQTARPFRIFALPAINPGSGGDALNQLSLFGPGVALGGEQ
jgi:hypothetical protein